MFHGWRQTGNHQVQSHYFIQNFFETLFVSKHKSLSLTKLMKIGSRNTPKISIKYQPKANIFRFLSENIDYAVIIHYYRLPTVRKQPKTPRKSREQKKLIAQGKKLDSNSFSNKEIRSMRKRVFFSLKKTSEAFLESTL